MPQTRKYGTNAQRQAAYRARAREAQQDQLRAKGLPPLPALPTVPGVRRWRGALDQACHLIALVAQEMAAYGDQRSEDWQDSDRADAFRERLEAIEDLQQQAQDCLADWE
jgi:hypothetical protein